MKVKCGKCQTGLEFDESKVKSPQVVVSCPKCKTKNKVIIKNQKEPMDKTQIFSAENSMNENKSSDPNKTRISDMPPINKKENPQSDAVAGTANTAEKMKERVKQKNEKGKDVKDKVVVGAAAVGGAVLGSIIPDLAMADNEDVPEVEPENLDSVAVADGQEFDQNQENISAEIQADESMEDANAEDAVNVQPEYAKIDADGDGFVEAIIQDTDGDGVYDQEYIAVEPTQEIQSEGLSFDDAFAMAREELGPGGVFEWNGNKYQTYYKDEWEDMSESEQQDAYDLAMQEEDVYNPEEDFDSDFSADDLQDDLSNSDLGLDMDGII
jgi:hypothetical protein